MNNVINIVNFIRGCDTRTGFDLKYPVVEQVKLAEKYQMPMTFLYQYDALIKPDFVDLLKGKEEFEIGVWLENSIYLVENAGLVWRGREGYEWDWHSNVDMTVGYSLKERKMLIDELMRKFKEIFGAYPKTAGSWALDAYSIQYMKEQYGIEAAMICKEQWGTDGYSMWGGYYSGAYYPSKNNMFSPAQSIGEQIEVPVFRMLGSDPITQYMNGIGTEWQQVETMEPTSSSGADEKWVRWYLDEMFGDKNIGFNYCQAGQENSFGWDDYKDAYEMQMKLFDEKRKNGEIALEFVSETGKAFQKMYSMTPCTTVDAHKENSGTLWFNSKYYRGNLYYNNGEIMLRDLFLFDEQYKERYFDAVAEGMNLYFDNLPLIDCFRWSQENQIGGAYFVYDGKKQKALCDFKTEKIDDQSVVAEIETEIGHIKIIFREKELEIEFPKAGCSIKATTYKDPVSVIDFENGKMKCEYEHYPYHVELQKAVCEIDADGYTITPDERVFKIKF